MAVEDQVAVVYAATNGYLDRIDADRVAEFHAGLVERLHADASETLDKIADGDWSDETQKALDKAIAAVRRGLRLRPRRGGPAALRRATRSARAAAARGRDDDVRRRRRRRVRGRRTRRRPRPAGAMALKDVKSRIALGQEHPEDHAGDGDGRRRAPAPRRAAHRGAAALRGRDPADDAPGGRGGAATSRTCRSSTSTRPRTRSRILLVTGDRGLAGAFNSQIVRAGVRAGGELRGRGQDGRLVRVRAPRRVVADVPRPRGRRRATPASPTARRTPTRARSPPT